MACSSADHHATGIPHPVAAAAHTLYQVLHSSELDTGSDTRYALRLAVVATVEAAHLHIQATRRSDLRGMASGVSALTQAVFDQVPGARSLNLWRQLERLDGPALISIPAPVRTELLRQATGNLSAATMAASASHSLLGADFRPVRPTARSCPTTVGGVPAPLHQPAAALSDGLVTNASSRRGISSVLPACSRPSVATASVASRTRLPPPPPTSLTT